MSTSGADERLDQILEVLLAYARQDFTPRASVRGTDTIDAIATGLNMLAEELAATVASRRELEAAYDNLRRTQATLVQSSKLAAVGLLASGVAHEVNTPVAWVSLAFEGIKRGVGNVRRIAQRSGVAPGIGEELDRIDQLLDDCLEGLKRMRSVVRDLLAFARSEEASFEPIDLEDVIASSWRLARTSLGESTLVLDLGDTPSLIANRGRVAQVVMNLLLNAAHAVRRASPSSRRIVVSTREHEGGVLLAVEDDGPGIPPELWERVFDPFFTTKTAADGTGLGLTIVGQIASSYGGWARVASPHGSGARIEVWLPCGPPVGCHRTEVT